jgi:hypothetical protein
VESQRDGDDVFSRLKSSAYVNGITLAAFQNWLRGQFYENNINQRYTPNKQEKNERENKLQKLET